MVVSLAVLYNVIFVLGRAVFWEMNNRAQITPMWWTLDYLCDVIYIVDALVHAHEGKAIIKIKSLSSQAQQKDSWVSNSLKTSENVFFWKGW